MLQALILLPGFPLFEQRIANPQATLRNPGLGTPYALNSVRLECHAH